METQLLSILILITVKIRKKYIFTGSTMNITMMDSIPFKVFFLPINVNFSFFLYIYIISVMVTK